MCSSVILIIVRDINNAVLHNKIQGNHDRPFGGKLEGCFSPSDVNRTNFIVLRLDQSPFHLDSLVITPSSLRSGIQNPIFNSLFSDSVSCNRTSSRFDGGRPLRRSCCNCSISGTLRLMCLLQVSMLPLSRSPGYRHTLSLVLSYHHRKVGFDLPECSLESRQLARLSTGQKHRAHGAQDHQHTN